MPKHSRPRPHPWSIGGRWGAGTLLLLLGGFVALCATVTHSNVTALRTRGLQTQATVVDIHTGRQPTVDLQFDTRDGQQVTAHDVGYFTWNPKPHLGQQVTIVYDPQQPADDVADTRYHLNYFKTWLLGLAAAASALLAVPTLAGRLDWSRGRRPR